MSGHGINGVGAECFGRSDYDSGFETGWQRIHREAAEKAKMGKCITCGAEPGQAHRTGAGGGKITSAPFPGSPNYESTIGENRKEVTIVTKGGSGVVGLWIGPRRIAEGGKLYLQIAQGTEEVNVAEEDIHAIYSGARQPGIVAGSWVKT